MNNLLAIAGVLLAVCAVAGFFAGMALHRRMNAAWLADLDGDTTALRLALKNMPAPPEGNEAGAKHG
jgi:hypothetical protein